MTGCWSEVVTCCSQRNKIVSQEIPKFILSCSLSSYLLVIDWKIPGKDRTQTSQEVFFLLYLSTPMSSLICDNYTGSTQYVFQQRILIKKQRKGKNIKSHCYSCTGILFSHEQAQSPGICYNMDELPKCTKEKKPDTNDHTSYNSIYMKCPEQINSERQNAYSWLPELGMGSDC